MKKEAPDRKQRSLFSFFAPIQKQSFAEDAKEPLNDESPEEQPMVCASLDVPYLASNLDGLPYDQEPRSPTLVSANAPCTSGAFSQGIAQTRASSETCQVEVKPEGPPPGNAYERERLDRIRRNAEMMHNLGLGPGGAASIPYPGLTKEPKHQPSKKSKRVAPDALRRSQRRRGCRQEGNDIVPHFSADKNANANDGHASDLIVDYNDSSVHQYICDRVKYRQSTSICQPSENRAPYGFAQLQGCLYDPSLSKAYSVDWRPGLVVAGGKDGQAAVWGSGSLEQEQRDLGEPPTKEEVDDCGNSIMPLMSYRLHKGWISDVQFCSGSPESTREGQHPLLLLSAGNDGALCLWDVSKSAYNGSKEIPKCEMRSLDIHSAKGIFSMHACGSSVATASKDCSVAVSAMTGTSSKFSVIRRYDDLHDGQVVKCVRWQSNAHHVLASCGNDRAVRIVDTRANDGSSLILRDMHSTCVNCVRWNPQSSTHMLLSASHDPHVILHDIRRPDVPLHLLTGHCSPNQRLKTIYQPAFVGGGTAVVAAGDPSDVLTLWFTSTGAAISRGAATVSIGATFCGTDARSPLLCSANRCVVFFSPNWLEDNRNALGDSTE